MKKNVFGNLPIFLILSLAMLLGGCTGDAENEATDTPDRMPIQEEMTEVSIPPLPEKLEKNADGVPILDVYQVDEEETREMDIETYLLGVLAGEMKNDWPMEALKAQAILARTFVLKFCTEKESKYAGADISTDIEEAQAYDATGINERIEQAVRETRGMVLSHQGELPYAWFHAHSGGTTASAREGLGYDKAEPGYTKMTTGEESPSAPDDAKEWKAVFPSQEILRAAGKIGLKGQKELLSIKMGEKGESGRLTTILINGQSISAPELRIALGSSVMRSTLVDSLIQKENEVMMSGRGYGHGVGMPQWGAYGMAQEGKKAEEIVTYYFQNVSVETLW